MMKSKLTLPLPTSMYVQSPAQTRIADSLHYSSQLLPVETGYIASRTISVERNTRSFLNCPGIAPASIVTSYYTTDINICQDEHPAAATIFPQTIKKRNH